MKKLAFLICFVTTLVGCSNVPYHGGPHEDKLTLDEVTSHVLGDVPQHPQEIFRAIWYRGDDLTGASVSKGVALITSTTVTQLKWDSVTRHYIVGTTISLDQVRKIERLDGWGAKLSTVVITTKNQTYMILIGSQESAYSHSEEQAKQFVQSIQKRIAAFQSN